MKEGIMSKTHILVYSYNAKLKPTKNNTCLNKKEIYVELKNADHLNATSESWNDI